MRETLCPNWQMQPCERYVIAMDRDHVPITKRRLLYTLAAGLLLLGGCIPLPGGHALTRKTVASKEGEGTLVADDGARCSVPPDTFAAVQAGDEHACIWKERGGKPEHTAAPPRVPDPLY